MTSEIQKLEEEKLRLDKLHTNLIENRDAIYNRIEKITNPVDEVKLDRQLNKIDSKIKEIENEYECIEYKINKIKKSPFYKSLFDHFQEFNYKKEKEHYSKLSEKAREKKVVSLILKFEKYQRSASQNISLQEWLWRCVLIDFDKYDKPQVVIEIESFRLSYTIRQVFDDLHRKVTGQSSSEIDDHEIKSFEIVQSI